MNNAIAAVATAPLAAEPLPGNLEGACRALEKVFAQMMFQKMREAMVPASSSGADGFARASTEAMLDGQWAELASTGEGLGLWRALYRQLDAAAVKSPAATPDQEGNAISPGPGSGTARLAAYAAYRQALSRSFPLEDRSP